jgi:hypothetical protein
MPLEQLGEEVRNAQLGFARLIDEALQAGPITIEQYVRYLSMQYHLTKGVQRYFYAAAAHPAFARRAHVRKFLIDFGNEEESHYALAERDIRQLGREILPEPFDVTLWHAYHQAMVAERPFVRLGGTVILENISGGPAAETVKRALKAPFVTRENSRFLSLHQHEGVPHGEEVLDVLNNAQLSADERADLLAGAKRSAVMYLRMAHWALDPAIEVGAV